jgi:hypothetical protein
VQGYLGDDTLGRTVHDDVELQRGVDLRHGPRGKLDVDYRTFDRDDLPVSQCGPVGVGGDEGCLSQGPYSIPESGDRTGRRINSTVAITKRA